MSRSRMFVHVAVAVVASMAFAGAFAQATKARAPSATRVPAQTDGEYLARAGDCIACHTARGGEPFAGGLEMPTPFGTIFTPNITPDPETGIGKWTADDFYRALHEGKSKDGSLLYPAFPYPSYTKVTRADSDAIYGYIQTITPVKKKNKPHAMKFPYNQRNLLIGWRALYFQPGEYKPDPKQIGGVEPRRVPGPRPRPLRRLPHEPQRAGGDAEGQGAVGRPHSAAGLVRAVAHVQSRSGAGPVARRGGRGAAANRDQQSRAWCSGPWRRWSTTACNTSPRRTRRRWRCT